MKQRLLFLLLLLLMTHHLFAGDIDDKTITGKEHKIWYTFRLSDVRLSPGSPFYNAMITDQKYMLGMDVNRMLNGLRKRAGLPQITDNYPGSHQPDSTRPGDLNHYLSAISLMYAQTGDKRFLDRADYIVAAEKECADHINTRINAGDTTIHNHFKESWQKILNGHITLDAPDETGNPWGGTTGNDWYGIHKRLASLRDAYLYCDNETALGLWKQESDTIAAFVLKVNPDLFDDMLDIEHGGMNEVFADLYALTGNTKYMDVSKKFNHQKVILNIANGNDILYGRHANMQVPTFVGTARQYQLTGDDVSRRATEHFLDIVYKDHTSVIGGSGRYERYGKPGETTKELGFTSDETCVTYNMLKVALNEFESTGDMKHMNYFERALYNHILASQDRESGGVTYYTSLMPGSFKSFSDVYNLGGVWCCVGTGMENHAKYGEAIYLHNDSDLLINLFIPSQLSWVEKGLQLSMQTKFPADNNIVLHIDKNDSFSHAIFIRKPSWVKGLIKIQINDKPVTVVASNGYIRLTHQWKKGDVITINMPQDFHLEPAHDDPNMVAVFHGPILLAGELGTDEMPGSDLVKFAHVQYRNWTPPTNDIPILLADTAKLNEWLKPAGDKPLHFMTLNAGFLNDKQKDISLIPYYQISHQRMNVYWKLYTLEDWKLRKKIVSDELTTASSGDEKAHHLQGEKTDTSSLKDDRNFWENNRAGRFARNGGWFSYTMKLNQNKEKHYLVVTYWGGTSRNHNFDVMVNDSLIATETLDNPYPVTYYDKTYELPEALVKGKESVIVTFKAKPGAEAGFVFALRTTSDPKQFANYLFY